VLPVTLGRRQLAQLRIDIGQLAAELRTLCAAREAVPADYSTRCARAGGVTCRPRQWLSLLKT
jgi:hypothetical protein